MRLFRLGDREGFTMIELIVVVVVLGILASIAIPIHSKYVKSSRITEATGRMGEIITACKAWAMEHPNVNGVPMWPTGPGGVVDLTATDNFTYGITATNPGDTGTLTVTASGAARMSGVNVVITVAGVSGTGGTPVITGF